MDIRFPEALTKHRNWVCWKAVPDQRKGRIRKVPMNARTGQAASSTDSATRCSVEEALDVLKSDLKALTADVQVEQEEYDEVVVIKPLFLVSDYQ